MRVLVLQEGGAPWRGEGGKLAEKKHLLWLKSPVLSAIPSGVSLQMGSEAGFGGQRKLNQKPVAGCSASRTRFHSA